MTSPAQVLVIGLDAADAGLVRELASAGGMPALRSLLVDAGSVDLLGPEGVFVSAAWPTMFTADRPDRHGYLTWDEIAGGTYERRPTSPKSVKGVPFWERLSETGRRVAVFDVPHTVARPLNGLIVSEWLCHDRELGVASWPRELAGELSAAHGSHIGGTEGEGLDQFAPCDYARRAGSARTEEESELLFRDILDGLERKSAASLELLDRGGWDLYMVAFCEAHCIGHQMWDERARVAEVYRRLDGVVARHLERCGPDSLAYVLMSHGMTNHHDGIHLLDGVLGRLDWALDNPKGLGAATRAASAVASALPSRMRRPALRAAAPLVRARAGHPAEAPLPPLAERRWFLTPTNTSVGGVRLNLAGREPRGRVPADEVRQVLGWLSARLHDLVNVDTGGPVVTRCVIADDVYRRSAGDALPDLFVEWERSASIDRVWSPATGTISAPDGTWRQGDHAREGLLVGRGPGIEAGLRGEIRGLEDVGATISAAAGLRLEGVDGRPIASLTPQAAREPVPRG